MNLRDWLKEKPFSLALSSGYFGFYAHCGFLAALEEADLLPARVSGASAGALAGGCWAAGLSAEAIKEALFALKREDFWDPALGPGLLRGRLFAERLKALLKVKEIQDCRIPLAISAFNLLGRRTDALVAGDLNKAIRASCAVPFLFQPVWLQNVPYFDGGIADKFGFKGIPANERVLYHHLLPNKWFDDITSGRTGIPPRADMQVVTIARIPRVNPFNLAAGKDAFAHTYREVKHLLAQQITIA